MNFLAVAVSVAMAINGGHLPGYLVQLAAPVPVGAVIHKLLRHGAFLV